MARPHTRRRKWLFRGLMLVFIVLMLEAGSYLAVNTMTQVPHPRRSETHLLDAHRNHRLNPDYEVRGQRLHSPDGWRRDAAIPLAKPEKTVRIVVLGTSAIYGIGSAPPYKVQPPLENSQTVPAQLEKLLNETLRQTNSGWQVQVINGGISAYKTFHHLVHLNQRLLAYKPDVVINIDGHNDFYFSRQLDRWPEYAYSTSILVDEYNGRSFFLPFFTFNRAMSRYSNFCHLLERLSRRMWLARVEQPLQNTPSLKVEPLPEGASLEERVRVVAKAQYLRDLWQIHQLGKFEGFEHLVFLQPEVVFEPDEKLVASDRRIKQLTIQHLEKGHDERMVKIRRLLPQLFKEQRIPFFDVAQLTQDGTAQEALYIDYCHLSPAGARRLALAVYEHLRPVVMRRVR